MCEARGASAGADDRLSVAEGEAAATDGEEVEDGGVGRVGLPPAIALQAGRVNVVNTPGLTAWALSHTEEEEEEVH